MSVKPLMMISLSALTMACAPKEPVKYLALSFDYGPNLTTESKMLDVLAKHDVPATFLSRHRVCNWPAGLRASGSAGQALGAS